jgi:hypothetical protein
MFAGHYQLLTPIAIAEAQGVRRGQVVVRVTGASLRG